MHSLYLMNFDFKIVFIKYTFKLNMYQIYYLNDIFEQSRIVQTIFEQRKQ